MHAAAKLLNDDVRHASTHEAHNLYLSAFVIVTALSGARHWHVRLSGNTCLPLGPDATDHDSCTTSTKRPGMISFTTQRIEASEWVRRPYQHVQQARLVRALHGGMSHFHNTSTLVS